MIIHCAIKDCWHNLNTRFGRLFFLLYVTLPSFSLAQVTADFNFTLNNNCAPAQVVFTNNSSGQTQSEWDFGNGNVVVNNELTVYQVYLTAGDYTVTLSVTNGAGQDEISHTVTISEGPEAGFDVDFEDACVPGILHFTDASVPGDAAITGWSWDFRNGILRSGQNQVVNYLETGTYDILLTVTDANNCTDFIEKQDYIHIYPQPQTGFTPEALLSCTIPSAIDLDNTTSSSVPLDYYWDYGNGDTDTTIDGQTTYYATGDYMVQLTVSNDAGCYGVHSEEISIQENITTSFVAYQGGEQIEENDIVCPGTITLINTTGVAADLTWELGHGNLLSGDTVNYELTQAGAFSILLRSSTNSPCVNNSSLNFTIDNVKADFEITSDITCNFPLTVEFNNLSENASVYIWNMAQGHTSLRENPEITIQNIYTRGDYHIIDNIYYYVNRLVVVSPNGCRDTAFKNLEFIHPDARGLVVDENRGCIPLEVNFYDKSDPTDISSRTWLFDDGSAVTTTTRETSHTYMGAGEYNVRLVLTDNKNCRDTSDIFLIEAGDVLSPDFSFTPQMLCYNDAIHFTDETPGDENIDYWHYSSTANIHTECEGVADPDATIHATEVGYHDITLTVDYNGCFSSHTKENAVYIRGPVASFRDSATCEVPLTYYFKGDIDLATDISWNYGDSYSTVGNENVNHTYGGDGDYNVVLTTSNDTTGCTHVYEREIYARTISAAFSMETPDICVGDEQTYNGSASSGYINECSEAGFAWFFDYNTVPYLSYKPTRQFAYGERGAHNVTLVVKDINGCVDSATAVVNVHQPEPDFEVDVTSGCVPQLNVKFTNTSTDPTITSYRFVFGDGNFVWDTPEYTYSYLTSESVTYNAGIVAFDAFNCSNNLYTEISLWKPDASFTASDETICAGDVVTFNPTESDPDHIYWKFGSNPYTEGPATHTFNTRGLYNVGLVVEKNTCRDTVLMADLIHVEEADASFITSDTILSCYPQTITFTHTAAADPAVSGVWNFGDGNMSDAYVNPVSFSYSYPGTFYPSLQIETANGCTDSKNMEVVVNGPYATVSVDDDAPCVGDTITFTMANAQDVYDFQWDFGDGSTSKLAEADHAYQSVNDYIVSLIIADINGCIPPFITREINVEYANVDFELTDSSGTFCTGDFIQVLNSSEAEFYFWRVNGVFASGRRIPGNLSDYTIEGENYISLEARSPGGCNDVDSVRVLVYPVPTLSVSDDQTICGGQSVQLQAITDGAEEIQWVPTELVDEENSLNTVVQPLETTTYTIHVANGFGCANHASVTVFVQPYPEIYRSPITEDTVLYLGDEIPLLVNSSNESHYTWTPGEFLSCDTCTTVIASPNKDITYYAVITDGCYENTEQFTIYVIDPYIISVPDVFTPNNDGVNDIIYVRGQGIQELIEFRIYNRWGNMVYMSNDINDGWDGYYKGKLQNTDIYTYVVRIITERGREIEQKGTFHLLH